MRRMMRLGGMFALVLLAFGFAASMASAQGGGGGGGGGGFGGGQFDPAQFRQTMVDNMRDQITATDDEWKVISPLVLAILEKQQAPILTAGRGRGGFGGFGGGRRGAGGAGAAGGGRRGGAFGAAAPEVTALETAAADDKTTNDDLKAKLKALRDARKKAEDDLKAAREKLRGVLNVRQEAQFVLAGTLD